MAIPENDLLVHVSRYGLTLEKSDRKQMWKCVCCDCERQWGFGQPYDKALKLLGCEHCGRPTRHRFHEVAL